MGEERIFHLELLEDSRLPLSDGVNFQLLVRIFLKYFSFHLSSYNISFKIIYLKIWSVTIWWNFWHIRRFQFFVVNIFPINAWKTEDQKVCQVWSSFSLHLWTICDFLCHQHHFLDFQFSLSCQWPIVFLSNPWRHSSGSWANQFYLEWIIWMKIKERRTKNYYHDEDNSFFLPPRIFS